MSLQKNTQVEIWDIEERPTCTPPSPPPCDTSPCLPVNTNITEDCPFPLIYEGNLFSIGNIKGVSNIASGIASSGADFSKGKFSIWPTDTSTWPMLLYTFELESMNPSADGAFVHHWKNMHR
jgi:hypothetical protein